MNKRKVEIKSVIHKKQDVVAMNTYHKRKIHYCKKKE